MIVVSVLESDVACRLITLNIFHLSFVIGLLHNILGAIPISCISRIPYYVHILIFAYEFTKVKGFHVNWFHLFAVFQIKTRNKHPNFLL